MAVSSLNHQQEHPECPYAVALHEHEQSRIENEGDNQKQLKSCPAFENGACPFRNLKNADEVREKLMEVPPSHFTQNKLFVQILEDMHNKSTTLAAHESRTYTLPGGCPVQKIVGQENFTQALEDFSFSAIMAKMIEAYESKDSKDANSSMKEAFVSASKALHDETANTPENNGGEMKEATDEGSDRGDDERAHTKLSESLKSGTAVAHQEAEDVHFVRNFIRGKIDRDLYASLVLMLYHVYRQLEESLEQYAPQYFPSCHFPEQLSRKKALDEDMDFWHGSSENSRHISIEMSPATRDYVARIAQIAKDDPLLLLAHSYTRYMGDLSGGRILARVARRALDLDRHEGLAFYEFEMIDSVKLFKDQYRNALDSLKLTESQIQKLVGEANVAFLLNVRLFEELDVKACVPNAKVRPLHDALKFAYIDSNSVKDADSLQNDNKCPFLVQKKTETGASKNNSVEGTHSVQNPNKRCPWPFVLAHDPRQFIQDWKTWLLLGVVLCWIYSKMH